MAPKPTLWKLASHTKGKHLVLRNYLNAWLPIMSKFNGRILFIDGFAGPGLYESGEEGSPIIALNALKEHHSKTSFLAETKFVFIEKDKNRADFLQNLIGDPKSIHPLCDAKVILGEFDEKMTEILDGIDAQAKRLAPCFVMVDPFGVSGTPMSVLERILKNDKSEVYISFMYESVNRFISTPEFEIHLNLLFGTDDWKQAINMTDRKDFLLGLYDAQLRKAGAKHVIRFDLFEKNSHVYSIFFGTHHSKGCDRMKQSIWKIDPFGNFEFHAARLNQMSFLTPNFDLLIQSLLSQFRNQGWIGIELILDFVASDKTDFHTSQVKDNVLKPLEKNNLIEVKDGSRKKRFTYPPGTVLRFI